MVRPWRIFVVLTLLAGAPRAPSPEQVQATQVQLQEKMVKLAERNAWKGVEEAWIELEALRVEVQPSILLVAADAARNRGDVWNAYQRLLRVLQVSPDDAKVHEQMRQFREGYGRLTVRRVDDSPIALTAGEVPFDPVQRHAVDFATAQLRATGGFDGMLPLGSYTVGPHSVTIVAGLDPVIVQRVADE